jgi:hypothetical protein
MPTVSFIKRLLLLSQDPNDDMIERKREREKENEREKE